MITSETPYKLAEIYRATWINLYNQPKVSYNNLKTEKQDDRRNT